MVSTGMARKVDDLGRIVLPVEMRRMFGIRPGDELEIAVDGASILLRKIEARCVFCGDAGGLRPYRDKQVCGACWHDLVAGQAARQLVDAPLGDGQV
jgi:transcriptional pleiotropic regulator of transition state genes